MAGASPRYSIFRHLAKALWPNIGAREVHFMVYGMTCYYDASSKQEVVDRPLVIVGIAAPMTKWTQFEERWAAILANENIPYFDTAACSGRHGDYKGWSDERRALLLDQLAATIADTASHFACAWMLPADYHTVNREYKLDNDATLSTPYASLATLVGELLNRVVTTSPFVTSGVKLVHVFEYGDCGQGPLRQLASRDRFAASFLQKWNKETDDKVHAFAACDLVAHYIGRSIVKFSGTEPYKVMPMALQKHITTIARPYEIRMDVDALRQVCELFPEDHPKRDDHP